MKNKYRAHPILTFFFCLALLAGFAPAALAAENVEYINANGDSQTCESAVDIASDTTAWNTGWYVVNQDVEISSRITVSGEVNLILADGCTLNAQEGITVGSGNSLTIYGQSVGSGTLNATGRDGSSNSIGGDAGIGGMGGNNSDGGNGGTLTINGGTVNATGGTGGSYGGGGAGIGGGGGGSGTGGSGGNGCTVIIAAGTVTATGGDGGMNSNGGAGIGSGGGSGVYPNGGVGNFSTGTWCPIITAIGGKSNNGSNPNGAAISDTTSQSSWSGVFFEGSNGTIYSDTTLTSNCTIESGKSWTIPEGVTLTVKEGVTLTNRGSLFVFGKFSSIDRLSGIQPTYGCIVEVSAAPDTVKYGDEVTITATLKFENYTGKQENWGKVAFYLSDGTNNYYLGDGASFSGEDGTYTASCVTNVAPTVSSLMGQQTIRPEFSSLTANEGTPSFAVVSTGSKACDLTINKADQTAPDAPTQNGTATADTITLNAITTSGQGDVQYACVQGSGSGVTAPTDDTAWTTSTEFTGLTAGTAYTFYARYAGNDFYNSSPASEGKTIYTAYAAPEDGEGYRIDLTTETITIDSSYEVNTAQDFNGTSITSGTSLVNYVGHTLFIRHVGNKDGAPASTAVTLTIPGRANTPSYPTVTATTTDSITIRTETGVEYRLGENGAWQPGSGQTLTFSGLEPGKQYSIYARRPATDSTFASAALKLDVTTASASSGSAGGSSASGTSSGTSSSSGTAAQQATPYYTCPACGTHNWTATAEGYRCDNCGHIVTAQLSGYGNVKGSYDPATASGTAANTASAIPQTGDSSEPALWAVVCLLSAGALVALGAARRKRQ